MTVKSKISMKEESEEISYPVLMESISKFVVLFIGEDEGTVVHDPKDVYGVGHYSKDWVEATNLHHWTPVKGTVEISN